MYVVWKRYKWEDWKDTSFSTFQDIFILFRVQSETVTCSNPTSSTSVSSLSHLFQPVEGHSLPFRLSNKHTVYFPSWLCIAEYWNSSKLYQPSSHTHFAGKCSKQTIPAESKYVFHSTVTCSNSIPATKHDVRTGPEMRLCRMRAKEEKSQTCSLL